MTSVSADTRLSSLLRYFLCAIMFLVIAVPLSLPPLIDPLDPLS